MLISCFSFTEVAKEASKIMKEGGSLLTLHTSLQKQYLIIMLWEFVNQLLRQVLNILQEI